MSSVDTFQGPAALQNKVGRLVLDGAPVFGTIKSMEMTLSEGAHDEVVMVISSDPNEMDYGSVHNKAASFTFGDDTMGRFFGYVTNIQPDEKWERPRQVYVLSMLGMSMVMKTGKPRFYNAVGADTVLARLAKDHRLGFSDEFAKKHYVWPTLAQTDESDWEFATDLARRIGGSLICTRGVLRLIDPNSVLRRQLPVVFTTRNMNDGQNYVYDFAPAHYSDRLPSNWSPRVSYTAGGRATVAETPARTFSGATPVRNSEEAAMAQVRLPVDWEEQASARLQGDHRIVPGTVIQFETTLLTTFKAPYDGMWYVWRVQHNIRTGIFQTRVEIARVTHPVRSNFDSTSRFWFMGTRGAPQVQMSATGQWISSWR